MDKTVEQLNILLHKDVIYEEIKQSTRDNMILIEAKIWLNKGLDIRPYMYKDLDIFDINLLRHYLEQGFVVEEEIEKDSTYQARVAYFNKLRDKVRDTVDITKFNEKQKIEIERGINDCLNVSLFAKPEYTAKQMHEIVDGLLLDLDVSWYLDKRFNAKQMSYIKYGLILDKDVSLFANPRISGKKMQDILEKME